MAYVITCDIKPGALDTLLQHRRRHLLYIRAHQGEILFGGPARSLKGTPETMIIVLKTSDYSAAQDFIQNEPYQASGDVFRDVTVRPWSQIIPPVTEGALDDAIDAETKLER